MTRHLQLASFPERFGLSTIERESQGVCGMGDSLRAGYILAGSREVVVVTCWQDVSLEGSTDTRRTLIGWLTVDGRPGPRRSC